MKSALVFVLTFFTGICFAQSVQQGKVLCYQGSDPKTPLPNVAIAASNAPAVISDAEGSFALSFRTLHAGDAIQFRRVELAGYEVMNQEALENARVSNPNANSSQNISSGLTIVLAKRDMLRQLRDGYRSVAAQRYEKQLQATEAQLEEMKKAGKLAEEQYNARMDSLEADYEEKLSKLETYIDKFARIDLSDLDADEQQIISLVQAGDFDGALKIYESQNLAQRLKKSREEQAKLVAARDQLADAATQKAREREHLMASIDRQVTLLLMAGGEENQMKVLKIRHEVFLADETDVIARRNYAMTLQNIAGDIQQANDLLLDGVSKSNNDLDKGQMLIEVAFYSTYLGEYESAIKYAIMADSLLWPLREKEHKVLTRSLPILTFLYLKYLQYLPSDGKDLELSGLVRRLRDNWNPDYRDPNSLLNYVDVLASLTDYDSEQENHKQSLWDAREAIRLDSCLVSVCPYLSTRYSVFSKAASIFAFEGKIDELIDAANQSVESICEIYPKVKANQGVCNLVFCAYNVMENLVAAECYEAAEEVSKKIDEIGLMERVQSKFPRVMDAFVGLYKIFCSQVLVTKGNVAEAKPLLEAGLQMFSADEENAMTLAYLKASSYARIEAAQGHYDKAESYYKEAIEVLMPKDKEPLDAWDADNICHYYLGIADLYLAQGNAKQAKKVLKQAEKYARFELDKNLIGKRK